MKKISSRSMQVPEMIRDLEPFETYGSFRATEHDGGYLYTGRLSNGYDVAMFEKHKQYIRYVVWSYSTPIAWWSPAYGWHKVRQTFSITTSKHQGKIPGECGGHRWEPFFDASLRDDLVCRRERGEHSGPVGYTDDGTLCLRHHLLRPAVKRWLDQQDAEIRAELTGVQA